MSDVAAPAAPVTNGATAAPTAADAVPKGPPAPVKEGASAPVGLGKANGKTAAPAPANGKGGEATAPKTAEELFEIVVNGEKRQLTRDQVIRRLQKEDASDVKFQKAGEAVKKANRVLELLKTNPREALSHLGVDVRAFAEAELQAAVEEAELTPEQKQHRSDAKELERLRNFEKTQNETEEKRAQEEKDKALFAQLEKMLVETADKHGLEGTPDNLSRIAEVANEWIEMGLPINPDHLISEVKEREAAAFDKLEKRVLGGLKGEALAKRLGPAVVEEVLRWSVQKLRGAPPAAQVVEAKPATQGQPKKWMTEAEFNKKHGF